MTVYKINCKKCGGLGTIRDGEGERRFARKECDVCRGIGFFDLDDEAWDVRKVDEEVMKADAHRLYEKVYEISRREIEARKQLEEKYQIEITDFDESNFSVRTNDDPREYVFDYDCEPDKCAMCDKCSYIGDGEECSFNLEIPVSIVNFTKEFDELARRAHKDCEQFAEDNGYFYDDSEYMMVFVNDDWSISIPYFPNDESDVSYEVDYFKDGININEVIDVLKPRDT